MTINKIKDEIIGRYEGLLPRVVWARHPFSTTLVVF